LATFGGADTPGIEIIMPDIEFINSIKKDLLGIILTHAHEDHMGALGRLWPQLECPSSRSARSILNSSL